MVSNRLHGPYSHFYWMLVACNIVIPQVLWSTKSAPRRGCFLCGPGGEQRHVAERFVIVGHELAT